MDTLEMLENHPDSTPSSLKCPNCENWRTIENDPNMEYYGLVNWCEVCHDDEYFLFDDILPDEAFMETEA